MQQQQLPLQTGSNNPFALGSQPQQQQQPQQLQQQQQQPAAVQQTPTGSQRMNNQYSELNALIATGTGIDTFGNVGETRVPAQHTKTGTFINSSGTGYKQENAPQGNPFMGTQYTGMPSAQITPAYTGYGFGNQPQNSSQQTAQQNGSSLIDL
ncbi:unnamed protein product [[Candida] boidinii]|uniref:Unnamed protein product n=1 Tax=Candida boidinii TaxID=5477 RepID=A0A9W6T067_CANBO|nr:unnamed protein product [[Candida] boidinii]